MPPIETHFKFLNAFSLCHALLGKDLKKKSIISREFNVDKGTFGEFYLPVYPGAHEPSGKCLTWSLGTPLFHQMHFIRRRHLSVSPHAARKFLGWKCTVLTFDRSHTNLFSLILGPRQGPSFSFPTCLYVTLSFRAMYSNCGWNRTGLGRTHQWGWGHTMWEWGKLHAIL